MDRKDIESLGFKYFPDRDVEENYGKLYIKEDLRFREANYILKHWENTCRTRIEAINSTLFEGTIKSKPELETLLKQIGIL